MVETESQATPCNSNRTTNVTTHRENDELGARPGDERVSNRRVENAKTKTAKKTLHVLGYCKGSSSQIEKL